MSGTETVRPSFSSTMRLSAVTRTFFAAAVSVARLEVVMPRLHQFGLVLPNECLHSVQFRRREPTVVLQPNRLQPKLGCPTSSSDVDVYRFAAVARKEEQPIRSALEDRRAHSEILPAFAGHRYAQPSMRYSRRPAVLA